MLKYSPIVNTQGENQRQNGMAWFNFSDARDEAIGRLWVIARYLCCHRKGTLQGKGTLSAYIRLTKKITAIEE